MPKSGGTYNDYFLFSANRIGERLIDYWNIFATMFCCTSRPIISIISHLFVLVIIVLAIIGAVKCFKRDFFVLAYCGGSFLMLLLYDYQDDRFAFTIYPFFLIYAVLGIVTISNWRLNSKSHQSVVKVWTGLVTVYVLTLLIAFVVSVCAIQSGRYNQRSVDSPESIEMFDYINANIDDDAVICSFKPRVLYYFTNVYSYTWFNNAGHEAIADYILLTTETDESELEPYTKEHGALIWENGWYQLYKMR